MSTRKRRRDSLTAHSPKEDEDELSPSKTAGHRNAPLSTIKRRKLNIPSDPTAHSSILSKGLQLLFGSAPITGKGKEDIYEVDELAMGHEEGHVEHRHTGANRDNDDIWEVPDDDAATRRGIDEGASKSKSGKGSSKKASMAILEMIDAADQKEGMREKTAKKASSAKSTPKSVNKKQIGGEAEITPKRSVGRPKKEAQSETKEAANSSVKKVARKEATSPMAAVPKLGRPRTSDVLKKAKELSRAAIRNRLSAHGQDESDEEETEAAHTPTKRKRSQGKGGQVDVAEDTTETEATMDTDMSGLKGKPKNNNLEISTDSPRGILTPTKRGVARPRKSVAFEGTGEIDLGFKDIPSPANTTPGKPKRGRPPKVRLPEVKSLEEHGQQIASKQKESVERTEGLDPADSDDEACEVCKRYDSKKPNQIIFCDGCDYAAHQICAGVPQIPKGSWFCKVCLAEQNADLLDLHSDDEDATAEKMDIPDITGFEDHLRDMQRLLLDKLTGQRRVKLRGQDDEMQKVHQVVEQTVLAGEGNSMLIIGARGSGKTTLVESVIRDISIDHRDSFHVVRLNGFIHTDDKIALKEIWRQLGHEMEIEDSMTGKANASDTLASLLALLSHPSEISEDRANETAKSVIFILDEFDLFTTHSRQTLLYNLFDIAQARKAPIVVLGLTTRIDVVETLEKRVKSRFSHRYVHLSLPRTVPAFWDICKEGLQVDTEDSNFEGFDSGIAGQKEFLSFWHTMINDLYEKDDIFKHHVQSYFYRSKSIPAFFTSCILPIANLCLKNIPLTGRTFASSSISLSAPDSKLHMLQGLAELELALLIAAARLDIILDTDTCNFAMVYDEYSSLISKHKIQTSSTGVTALGSSAKIWGKDVALEAWERLAEYNLLVYPGIGGASVRDSGSAGRMWKVDIGLEEIAGSATLSSVMAKWCREI